MELLSFMMDPKYLYCLTCSIYELLIFKFSVLMYFFGALYFFFVSFIDSPNSNELFFSIRECHPTLFDRPSNGILGSTLTRSTDVPMNLFCVPPSPLGRGLATDPSLAQRAPANL